MKYPASPMSTPRVPRVYPPRVWSSAFIKFSFRSISFCSPRPLAAGDALRGQLQVSTRILGRRTAPFRSFLNPFRVPHGLTQDPSTYPKILVTCCCSTSALCTRIARRRSSWRRSFSSTAARWVARPSLIPSLCTQFTRAGIEWRR